MQTDEVIRNVEPNVGDKKYDLVVFNDGDARVYDHGKWGGDLVMISKNRELTATKVQTNTDKELLLKIARLVRTEYVHRYRDSMPDVEIERIEKTVDQTLGE